MNQENKPLGFGCHYLRDEDGTVRRYHIFDDAIRMDVMEEGTDFEPDDSTVAVIRLNATEKV
jgi:hypothetical protein